mmetsp:Transcript_12811/g.27539  ORF Transcript_12811/g.27539 Transcript_12811/m.27539 type:complete len:247 (+) Transcript_12811:139-879(+)
MHRHMHMQSESHPHPPPLRYDRTLTVEADADTVISLLWDVKNRTRWDDTVSDVEVLETYSANSCAATYSTRQIGQILGQRQLCVIMSRPPEPIGELRIIAFQSIYHRGMRPRRLHLEGHVLVGGFVVSPIAETGASSVTLVLDMDPMGLVPPPLARRFVEKQLSVLNNLRRRVAVPGSPVSQTTPRRPPPPRTTAPPVPGAKEAERDKETGEEETEGDAAVGETEVEEGKGEGQDVHESGDDKHDD